MLSTLKWSRTLKKRETESHPLWSINLKSQSQELVNSIFITTWTQHHNCIYAVSIAINSIAPPHSRKQTLWVSSKKTSTISSLPKPFYNKIDTPEGSRLTDCGKRNFITSIFKTSKSTLSNLMIKFRIPQTNPKAKPVKQTFTWWQEYFPFWSSWLASVSDTIQSLHLSAMM